MERSISHSEKTFFFKRKKMRIERDGSHTGCHTSLILKIVLMYAFGDERQFMKDGWASFFPLVNFMLPLVPIPPVTVDAWYDIVVSVQVILKIVHKAFK